MELKSDPQVATVFQNYPDEMKEKMLHLRNLVIETADSLDQVEQLNETLKWGEPSYLSKIGSTIRMDWKERSPNHYALYFTCTTGLVGAFRMAYSDQLKFEGNRAIVFHKEDVIPEDVIKHCFTMALTYKKIKHLPMLGI